MEYRLLAFTFLMHFVCINFFTRNVINTIFFEKYFNRFKSIFVYLCWYVSDLVISFEEKCFIYLSDPSQKITHII